MTYAVTFSKESHQFALVSIYENRLNCGIHKNLTTLRELQAERKRNYQHDLNEEATVARANDINGLPYIAPSGPSRMATFFQLALCPGNEETMCISPESRLKGGAG